MRPEGGLINRTLAYLRRHHWGMIGTFIALSGTAYAAVNLPSNSVGSGEIRANAVKSSEIAKNAVNKAEVAKGAIGSGETRNRSLTCADLATPICPGLADIRVRSASAVLELFCSPSPSGGGWEECASPWPGGTVSARCGEGETALAGGWEGSAVQSPNGVVHSEADVLGVDRPLEGAAGVPTGWTARGRGSGRYNDSYSGPPVNPTFTVYAICAG